MLESESEELVTVGSHVIIQRLNFKKVYRVSETGSLNLGKEEIKMTEIIGKPFWTTYKVISSNEKRDKRSKMTLIVAEKKDSLEDLKDKIASGYDNRSINDDGKSQKLSKDDILSLKDAGKSGREIVSSLIENNASFTEKTEYSQEKYIRKKEKKYCQFISVHKPTLAALQEIYLRQDPAKIYNLRMDSLAQILSYSDVKSEGTFMLYDSGTAGLVAAGMLSRIGAKSSGNLVYLHSGDHLPQMPIARAMNFPDEQFSRLTIASVFDFLKLYNKANKVPNGSAIDSNTMEINTETLTLDNQGVSDKTQDNCENNCSTNSSGLKRKAIDSPQYEGPVVKKSRKVLDIEKAVELVLHSKTDSLVIIAKEHPLNIIKGLLPFVQSSRPFVIYHANREVLQETYVGLKQENSVINIRLFSNFLRLYQVLPDRTHPDILMNDCGGYLLTGYTISE
ncbi:tRNA (adenine(58)-N(1))-methyltransferase non-catalytic subunit TRM6 [Phymastichus coffea]|uniref:tRNA (adenine(58)-N(1))-methyltransferase non-catalytic subunit TRM6 n=1 Tax=Phymastichus coffea TaxID=108790 RepID=UPI00273ADD93|nr:tRNA (adenine(58)-N(1))-methyltransferase non-catalytic subunit TRM6 [Phymastichus coffea]